MNNTGDTRIEFEVPTPEGRVTVRVPEDLSPRDAASAGDRIARVMVAMFTNSPATLRGPSRPGADR